MMNELKAYVGMMLIIAFLVLSAVNWIAGAIFIIEVLRYHAGPWFAVGYCGVLVATVGALVWFLFELFREDDETCV